MTPRIQTKVAEREAAILQIASEIVASEGANALTMERVLAKVEFSKGTLYNHFTCREDLLVALHVQCFTEHYEIFARGALFRGRARERMLATGLGDEIKHRLDRLPVSPCLTQEILEAASERWREAFVTSLRDSGAIFTGIVRDGIASGDLPHGADPEQISASVWALWVGAEELRNSSMILRGFDDDEFNDARLRMVSTLLDGYGWRPLSSETDYKAVRRRALEEVYGPEARKLGLL